MTLFALGLYIVVALVIAAFLLWIVESAPFISATLKPLIRWVVIVLCALFVIGLLLNLLGVVDLSVPLGRPHPVHVRE